MVNSNQKKPYIHLSTAIICQPMTIKFVNYNKLVHTFKSSIIQE